jgi:D-3-phosphoglycerate dehydrogenase / 2-oxoglutarate reductase
MQIVIPDDFPPVYQDHPEVARLQHHGEVVVYSTRAAVEEELIERLRGAEIVINVRAYTDFGERVVAALPELRLVSVLGTGTDNFDLPSCSRHGVLVVNTPGASTVSVAELTLALMLSVARHVALVDRKLREGVWYHQHGFELRGKVLGIVGLGLIGQEVARLGQALGMRVIAWSFRNDPERAAALGVEIVAFEELLRQSDVVSLHVRNSAETRGLIGRPEIGLMKPSAILINTARAAIIDEEALREALRDGGLAGAGLDVFLQEPLPADHPWTQLDNVVLTPHVGWVTHEAAARLTSAPVDNILHYLAGEPTNVVNPAALEHRKQQRLPVDPERSNG